VKDEGFLLPVLISLLFALCLAGPPALAAGPSFEEKFERGLSFYKKEEYAQALKIFQQIEEERKDPRSTPDAIFMQGQALRGLRNWPEAASVFSRAAEVHPLLSDYALFFQGEALQKGNEGEKSIGILQRLLTLYPQSLLAPRAGVKMADLNLQWGNYAETIKIVEGLLRKDAGKDSAAQARFLLGQAKEGLDQWSEAINIYQALWLSFPLHSVAPQAKYRWESLSREKEVLVERIPPEALFQRALQFYGANSFATALAEMDQIEGYPLQSYPAGYSGERWIDELYFHRGMCHFRLKQYAKALETFELIVQHSRNEPMAEKGLFWMLLSLVRNGQKEEALHACSLFQASYPQSSFMAQGLYLRAAVLEDLGKTAEAVLAYQEIAEKFPQSPVRFAALWSAGWLLYLKENYSEALQTWDRLNKTELPLRWTEKIFYWKGRVREKMGQTGEAEEDYGQLLRNFPTSYYSQLVSARGWPRVPPAGPFPSLEDRPLPPWGEGKSKSGSKILHLEKGKLLTRLGLFSLAAGEFEAVEEEGANMEEIWMEISRLYRASGEYYRSNLLVRKKFALKPLTSRAAEREKALYLLAYPPGNPSLINRYAQDRNLDPALLCAVILEESRFHAQAISSAGARGLMQIIPRTGRRVAKELQLRRFSADQLFDPGENIRLGSWYLATLLDEFGGKVHLALAAYNAGPHMVRKWLADGCSLADDEFVENIPYSETRNYVIRVITSAQVYRTLYWPPEKPAHP
jgi:soluble lytic murein transglycosylase